MSRPSSNGSIRSSRLLAWAVTLSMATPVAGLPSLGHAAPAAADTREVQLQTIYAEAQDRVGRYNATKDTTQLVVARELLVRWMTDHRTLYGDTAAAIEQRRTIEQQLQYVDAELARRSAPPTPAPAPLPAPATVAPAPAAAPTLTDADRRRLVERQKAQRLTNGGTLALSLGLVTTLGVSLPLWAARGSALRRAEEAEFRHDQDKFRDRARRRQTGAIATLASGAPFVMLGTALLAMGAHRRGRAERMAVAPTVAPTMVGATARLRF